MTVEVKNTVSLHEEMVAYETLWARKGVFLKDITEMFNGNKILPSLLLKQKKAENMFEYQALEETVKAYLNDLSGFSGSVYGTFQYPEKLRNSQNPIELFYYRGDIGLLESPSISVVGARKCTEEGLRRAKRLSQELVHSGYTIVSGLASGIDTMAMKTAIEEKAHTIGIIGTPLNSYYPKENQALQDEVAKDHLLISHVPFYRYNHEPFRTRKLYFVQRNDMMAALSEGTVIVEASDTSGSLTQAKACFYQKKKLFILPSALGNPDIGWPKRFLDQGAILVNSINDIIDAMKA
ncbi:DNA-processing protein DprA [Chloroflexota bacterium]